MADTQNDLDALKNKRESAMTFDGRSFAKAIINDLRSTLDGRVVLKKYKQSEVREIIENYNLPVNQIKLREISQLLFAKSPQYQRLLRYFSGIPLFSHVITPVKDITKLDKEYVLNQYVAIGELVKRINLKHEMTKVLNVAFKEDTFFGYIHKTKKDFYIQNIDAGICKITSIEDGVYNFSIDMSYFQRRKDTLKSYPKEIRDKYNNWEKIKLKNPRLSVWVELNARNTICIKINEEILESFPPFAGSFDSIFDIDGFKQLRKDKEELDNYMTLAMELPMRKDSDDNNDFIIDEDMMHFFHNMAVDAVPENVGVVTSPMKITPITFDKSKTDADGVAKAERDFWSGSGTSQLLFNSDKSTSQGLLLGIKTDETIVFGALTQIERWLNRYLKFEYSDLMFNINILHITEFNQKEKFDMYLTGGERGFPKSHIGAVMGFSPIEVMNMTYLENEILEFHKKFIPLDSSHTKSKNSEDGRPKKSDDQISDETARGRESGN